LRRRLLILGAGGHGRAVAEAVAAGAEYELVGFLDDAFPALTTVWDAPVLGRIGDWRGHVHQADELFVAIGSNRVREAVTRSLVDAGLVLATVTHPRAIISPRAIIGPGSAVMAGAIVGTEARLGVGVIVNCAAVVDHHCRVGDFGHLGVGAVMAGGSTLGQSAWVQAGAALGYGVVVADGVTLATGAAVAAP
jgi:sugar O-acyltransferase (sialic acid O-acetyltransferase NeuD family)